VEIPDDLSADIPTYFEVPPATTWDDIRVDVAAAESEAETDEGHLGVQEETIYEGPTDLEEVMVQAVVQTSLKDTTMVSSSGAKVDETPGTDSPIDGVTEMRLHLRLSLAGWLFTSLSVVLLTIGFLVAF